jgi:hypothetical protein
MKGPDAIVFPPPAGESGFLNVSIGAAGLLISIGMRRTERLVKNIAFVMIEPIQKKR